MNPEEMIAWINQASYYDLLKKWRFAESGDPFFQGKVGEHYEQTLREKREALPHSQQVETSKLIGWGR